MVITTKTIRCNLDLDPLVPATGNGVFNLTISHLVSKIVISHGAVVQALNPQNDLIHVTSSLVDNETLGIIPTHNEIYALPPRLKINHYFKNAKSIAGSHTLSARHISTDTVPIAGTYIFIIEFHE
jgi:hypothetical protein